LRILDKLVKVDQRVAEEVEERKEFDDGVRQVLLSIR